MPHHEIQYYVYIFSNLLISLQLGPVRPGGQIHRPVVVLQTPNSHSGLHSAIVKRISNSAILSTENRKVSAKNTMDMVHDLQMK